MSQLPLAMVCREIVERKKNDEPETLLDYRD